MIDKGMGKSRGSELSARPTFEFDLDFEEKSPDLHKIYDSDDKSISSSASKKIMKKVKNLLNRSTDKDKSLSPESRPEIRKKKGFTPPPANTDFMDAGPDDRSVKTGKTKKKKKKKQSQSVPMEIGDRKAGISDDDLSVSKRTRKKKKKKTRSGDDDDKSVGSVRSTRSSRSKMKKSRSRSKSARDVLEMNLEVDNSRRMNEMEIENAALLEETATIRRQLNEAKQALRKAQADNPPQANFDQMRELEIAQNEARELKVELEEYEDAVIEKDELIQKLTEAVDAQLDKVELLEVKLVRAEDEFCKMEEEMKDMEDVIENLKSESPGEINHSNSNHSKVTSNDEEILEHLQKREDEINKREHDLQKRESLIKEQDDQLKRKRSALLKPQRSLDNLYKQNRDTSNDVDELKAKVMQLEAENNDLSEEVECLRKHYEKKPEYQSDEEVVSLQGGSDHENETLLQELDDLKYENNSLTRDIDSMQNRYDKKIADSKLESEILRRELDDFKERKNSENEFLRQQIEELKKQKTHVEATSRQMRRMESMRMLESESNENPVIKEDNEFGLEVEVEIAELREKIADQEEQSRKLKQEISAHVTENDNLKQELQERELEFKDVETQLSKSKESSSEKMKQKDETITFMQNTMMQIMKEKQELDAKLRGSNLDNMQKELMNRRAGDEAEKAKLEAINDELRKLDDENRRLEIELNQFKYNSSLELKEKESALLELQEELRDVKWELGAREKGADYVTLLKDRKERKNQLNQARKELKEAEEKIMELELQRTEMLSNKKDLEKEIETLNKRDAGGDIGEQISGLKRQIKSLKQHNASLERKVETESREFKDKLEQKDAKIRILNYEVDKLRNPAPNAAQNAIRGAVSGVMTRFGRRSMIEGNGANANTEPATTEDEEVKQTTENQGNASPGNLWKARFGRRSMIEGNGPDAITEPATTEHEEAKQTTDSIGNASPGNLWNRFGAR